MDKSSVYYRINTVRQTPTNRIVIFAKPDDVAVFKRGSCGFILKNTVVPAVHLTPSVQSSGLPAEAVSDFKDGGSKIHERIQHGFNFKSFVLSLVLLKQ